LGVGRGRRGREIEIELFLNRTGTFFFDSEPGGSWIMFLVRLLHVDASILNFGQPLSVHSRTVHQEGE
jgi:hypothetical protein